MIDWNTLRAEHGAAGAVSVLLTTMTPDMADEVVPLVWGELCDQGSVTPESFKALPELAKAAARWDPRQRIPLLALAGAILSPYGCGDDDSQDLVQRFFRDHRAVLAQLKEMCQASMSQSGVSKEEFVELLAAARSFDGDSLWAQRLDQLTSGEFQGVCPHCGVVLYLVVGDEGRFVTAEDWTRSMTNSVSFLVSARRFFRPILDCIASAIGSSNKAVKTRQPGKTMVRDDVQRNPILPATESLPASGLWLRDRCIASKQDDLARCIEYLFGSSTCPKCGKGFMLEQAISEA